MIKANDFRIDNWVHEPKRGYCQVNGIQLHSSGDTYLFLVNEGMEFQHRVNIKDISPIRLTDEILEQCGFEKGNISGGTGWTEYEYFHGKIDLVKDNDTYYRWNECEDGFYSYKSSIPINSLHQLQNLYLPLTGSELTINHTVLSQLH